MRTEDLIVELARLGAPVQPMRSPIVRFGGWAIVALAATAAAISIGGARLDVATAIGQPRFLGSLIVMLATALVAGWAAAAAGVPGAAESRRLRAVALAAAAAWVAGTLWALAAAGDPGAQLSGEPLLPACAAKVVLVALLPGAAAWVMIRRGAALDLSWTVGLAALGALAFGAIGAQLICPIDRAAHVLLWHIAPVAVLAAVATALGHALRTLFRRATPP